MKKFLFILLGLLFLTDSYSQIVKTHIGTSRYDLQTNQSIQRRVAVHPTSKDVIVTFTGANESSDQAFPLRGSGYLYFNSVSGQWSNFNNLALTPPVDTFYSRPEGTTRVGWPNPMFVGSKELIITHKSAVSGGFNGLYQISRATSGSGAWTPKDVTSGAETWPRVASDGNNIIAVSSHFETQFNGVTGGLMFVKSTDGGSNWSTPAAIDSINAENYPTGIGGDRYALDMTSSKVALLTGNQDITLYTSTNFGNTWTKKSIFPTSYNVDGTIIPRSDRSNGEYSVIIDNSGVVHCFWSRYILFSNEGAYSIDLTRAGIMYWNETMGNQAPIVVPGTDFFRENTKSRRFPFGRFNTESNSIGYVGSNGSYRNNTTAWPSSGIDASGTIYLSYAYNRGIVDTTPGNFGKNIDGDSRNGYNFYDVYVTKSTDNGKTWVGPVNVSSTIKLENTYPSMARLVDDNVHLVYQEDDLVGNAVMTVTGGSNGTGSQAGPVVTKNQQIYVKVPVVDIVNPVTDITNPTIRFNNNFQNLITSKSLTSAKSVLYAGCAIDTVTGKTFTKTKSYILDNYIEFSEDTSLLTIIGLDTINLTVPGLRIIRVTGRDLAGNLTLDDDNIFFDTLNIGIEILEDKQGPQFTLKGDNPAYAYLNSTYSDAGNNDDAYDLNPCNGPIASVSVSGLPVNTSTAGVKNVVYTAKDKLNNTTTLTRPVYVGVAPTAKVTDEAIVKTNKVNAKGETSLDLLTALETPNTFYWTVKSTGSTQEKQIGGNTKNLLEASLPSGVNSIDSICLAVSNGFNAVASPPKPKSRECKFLKYSVGISSVSNDLNVSIFPNPTNGDFNIKVEGNRENKARVVVTSMDGKTLSDSKLEITNSVIPFKSNLAKGTYFVSTEVDGKVYLDKIEVR